MTFDVVALDPKGKAVFLWHNPTPKIVWQDEHNRVHWTFNLSYWPLNSVTIAAMALRLGKQVVCMSSVLPVTVTEGNMATIKWSGVFR